ncbi:MAG: pyridoxal phosphate-dependent aminotransferase [Syntrophorhabdaceae bacterium]|nr:pyridoxal phosphate-dependent aminotransferase [Syntrophorhabdaceae bacterium]
MNDKRLTDRVDKITPFYVMELLEKAKAMEAKGEDIIHMEVGEPDFPTPELVKKEAIKAIEENHTFYTHSLGISELRQRIAEYYLASEGIHISPERIIITNGTSGAFLILFSALLDSRKTLVLSDPGYPCYRNFGHLTDAEIALIPVGYETRFQLTSGHIRGLKRSPHLVVISNPSNPTGTVYDDEAIKGLYNAISENGGVMIVDEIYSGLSYKGKIRSAASISDEIIIVNGFSKTYAMTGWRLGWMVIPKWLVRPVQKIAQNVFISPPSVSQYASIKAFEVTDDLERMRNTYEQRRDFMLSELSQMGFHIPVTPEGAFYIYANIEKWGIDSMEFVDRALEEAKVAITPGYDFGTYRAGEHIRFSYATGLERLQEGCKRLKVWLDRRCQ